MPLKSIHEKKSEQRCCQTQHNPNRINDTSLVLLFVRQKLLLSQALSVNDDDDDYGYNKAVSDISQLTAVELAVSNYLADPESQIAV